MIYKIIGAIIVTTSTSAIGTYNAKKYTNRVKILETLAKCVIFIENEMRFSVAVLSEILYRASLLEKTVICEILYEASEMLKSKSGDTFLSLWRIAIKNHSADLCDKDTELILSFAECLGRGDVEGQSEALKHYLRQVETTIEEIKPSCDKNARLSKSFGIYFGLLISVLLF